LAASGQIPSDSLSRYEFAGELALTGELRPIRGALAMTYKSYKSGRAFVLPVDSATEAALVSDAVIYPARSLLEVCSHLCGRTALVQIMPLLSKQKFPTPTLVKLKGSQGLSVR
jgi:magnesium chelatase family protein